MLYTLLFHIRISLTVFLYFILLKTQNGQIELSWMNVMIKPKVFGGVTRKMA